MREDELHRCFAESVRAFARRRVPDAYAAEDVAQETLCRVIAALRDGRVRDPGALPGFVFGTAHHLCAADTRSAGRERRLREREGSAAGAEPVQDALEALIARERTAAVRAALQSLAEPDRVLLRRFFYDDWEAERVARELGVAVGTVRVRKYRALRRLADMLEQAAHPPRRSPTSSARGGRPGGRGAIELR